MSRDLKHRQSDSSGPRRRGGSTLGGIFIGLVLGLCLAAGVAWYTTRGASPFSNKAAPPPTREAAPAAPHTASEGQSPAISSSKPGESAQTERRFQFYDILQGKTEPVPNKDAGNAKGETPSPDLKPSPQAVYLQAGAFSRSNEAENLKASLALQGIESTVQQVMSQDKTLYRVRLGPYPRPEDANRVRQDLSRLGIEAVTVK